MKNTTVCALIMLAISAWLGYLISVTTNSWEQALYIIALISWVVYVALTSFYVIRADQMVASFFLGTYQGTYISGTFARKKDVVGQNMEKRGGYRGLFGLDIVILLYPFWRGVIFPTGAITVRVHAGRVYTKQAPGSPSIPVHVDTTIVFGLAPKLDAFVATFDVLNYGYNLAQKCMVKYRLDHGRQAAKTEAGSSIQKMEMGEYEDFKISQVILDTAETAILEGVRVVGSKFPWRAEAGQDIRGRIIDFERRVLGLLSRPESVLTQAEIIEGIPQAELDLAEAEDRTLAGQPGPASRFIDFNAELVDVAGDKAKEALDRPMIEELEAEAQAKKGQGEAARIREIATGTGMTPENVLKIETLKNVDNLTIYGKDLSGALMSVFGGRPVGKPKPSPKPSPTPGPS